MKWYRYDVTDVSLKPIHTNTVVLNASAWFGLGAYEALNAGRFLSPTLSAHYIREDKLTCAEHGLLEGGTE